MRISTSQAIRFVEKSGEIISQWLKTVENVEEKHIFFAPGPMITAIESETMENLFALKPILHINEAEAKGYTTAGKCRRSSESLIEKSWQSRICYAWGRRNLVL